MAKRTIKLGIKSCLLDEDPDLREVEAQLPDGKVQRFFLRRVTDRERALARQDASTGQNVITFELTPAALEQMAKEMDKSVEQLSQREVATAARKFGKQGMTSGLDVEKYQTLLVYFALGGRKVLGHGDLGHDREGWDLADRDGAEVPVTMENLHDRLHPDVLDALQEAANMTAEVEGGSEKN